MNFIFFIKRFLMILIINITSIAFESIIYNVTNFSQISLNNVEINCIKYEIREIKRFLSNIIKKKIGKEIMRENKKQLKEKKK